MKGAVSTPEELYQKIERVSPYLGDGMLRRCTTQEMNQGYGGDPMGHYRIIDGDKIRGLERWDFRDVIALGKMF